MPLKWRVNGSVHAPKTNADGYLSIQRQWHAKDTVSLTLAMPIERVYAHPLVRENVGRFALRRGPLVYCFEDVDNPDGVFPDVVAGRWCPLRNSV